METPLPPQPTLPAYQFAELLGSGSYANVYRAISKQPSQDSGVRETYAIKCIERARIAPHQTAVNNLVREIGILKTLRHPHIVSMKDFRWDQKYVYLIMEYCSGGDLSNFIRQHRVVPELVVRRFLQQLASSLNYLRSRNISHMDLKPNNILLATKYQPFVLKLADFGFATYLRTGMDAYSFRGSPLYMAPEMFNQNTYDARVDLWSVGIILYECLYGRAPFSAPTLDDLISQIKSHTSIDIPRSNPELSPECEELLTGLLRKNPNHRFNFEEFFGHPFVDLEHAPSEETLRKATDLAKRAIQADERGRIPEAIQLYSTSLEYFLPCIQLVADQPDAKEAMRRRVQSYLRRAETLKRGMEPPSPTKGDSEVDSGREASGQSSLSRASRSTGEGTGDFTTQWSDVSQVKAALTVVRAARELEAKQDWSGALEKYTLAIESMMSVLKTEPAGSVRRDRLRAMVEAWIGRAEALQGYLQVQKISISQLVEEEAVSEVVDEEAKTLATESSCALQ